LEMLTAPGSANSSSRSHASRAAWCCGSNLSIFRIDRFIGPRRFDRLKQSGIPRRQGGGRREP
jgi:hypothetical protein